MFDISAWWDRLSDALQHPAFHAAFLAILIGIALTESMAHMLPSRMRKRTAEKLIRFVVAFTVMWFGYQFHRTTIGAGWAFFAGLSAPSIHHHLQAWAYHRWPALRPEALK